MTPPETDGRYERGLEALTGVHGETGRRVVDALAEIAPDFARQLVEFAYGDVYARPQLDRRTRQAAIISSLAALGHAAPELKVHIRAGLNVGLSRGEIVEILTQTAVYAGFPAALNALFAAREVFAELDASNA